MVEKADTDEGHCASNGIHVGEERTLLNKVRKQNTRDDNRYTSNDNIEREQVLKGKIGRYPVVMHLDLDAFEVGEQVGYYTYDSMPNKRFKLVIKEQVAVNASGSMKVVMYEYTSSGVHSGTFDGQYECRGDYYEGTFTNSKGKKFKFVLQ